MTRIARIKKYDDMKPGISSLGKEFKTCLVTNPPLTDVVDLTSVPCRNPKK